MIHASEVRRKLAALLRREISVSEFEQWLNGESPHMFSDSLPDAIDLVSSIYLLISEYYDDRLDEHAFRAELKPFLNNIREAVVIDPDLRVAPAIEYFSSSRPNWVSEAWTLPLPA